MKMNLKKGFTLIELLVVVAIIGILASIVLASLTASRTRAQAGAVQAQLSNMRSQAELYYATNSNYGTGYAAGYYGAGGITVLPTSSCGTDAGTGMFATGTNALGTLLKGACSSGATALTAGTDAATATKWAVSATAPGTNYYCVDSTGASLAKTSGAYVVTGGVCS